MALSLSVAAKGASARPEPSLMALSPGDIDATRLLAPPPERGSAAEKRELAELHDIQDHRTPERFDQAKWDDSHQSWVMFAGVLGPGFDLQRLPATAKVLAVVQNDEQIAAGRAKALYKRERPWSVDPSLRGCPHQGTDPFSSFPSGHATAAFALGEVLADLMPRKAQAILTRANDFAYSRLVCGVHYRSDTVGGEVLGEVVAVDILHAPQMQADLAAARVELNTAGL
jgi:hypothetical protein